MADPQSTSASTRESQLQEAYDRSAEGMDLRLESSDSVKGEVCAIGVAIINFAPIVEVDLDPVVLEAEEDEAIRETILGYESLDPEAFARRWKEFAHEPHVGVGAYWLSLINDELIRHWLTTEDLRRTMELFPAFSPRQLTLEDLRITYIGNARASATYRLVETYRNGKISAGNVAAILMKLRDQGWRIMVATKGGRYDISDSTAEV